MNIEALMEEIIVPVEYSPSDSASEILSQVSVTHVPTGNSMTPVEMSVSFQDLYSQNRPPYWRIKYQLLKPGGQMNNDNIQAAREALLRFLRDEGEEEIEVSVDGETWGAIGELLVREREEG